MKNKKGGKEDKINLLKLNTLATRIVYWLFEIFIAATMIYSIVFIIVDRADKVSQAAHISHAMLCALALVLYNIPSFVQWKFRIYIPSAIHIFILVFIAAHFILGEVQGVYTQSLAFDKILHATSGFAIALGGFSLVNIFNKSSNTHLKLSPFFVALFSFCFALSIALLWEIIEFASDTFFGTNMQRYLPPEGIDPKWEKQGYGLVDTMGDVIVSTCSALVVCILGYIALRKKANYLNRFLLRKIPDYDTAINEAVEAGDEKLAAALRKAKEEALHQIMAEPHHGFAAPPPQEETAQEEITQEEAREETAQEAEESTKGSDEEKEQDASAAEGVAEKDTPPDNEREE